MRALSWLVFAPLAIACGPSKMIVSPGDVTRVDVRPASGQGLFCPGDAFQIELIARTKDGAACSSTDRRLGCKGKSDAVLEPSIVRVQAWPADVVDGDTFTFRPAVDPLVTAGTGLMLRGWIEHNGAKSIEGKNNLKPVYTCQAEHVLGFPPSSDYSAHGGPGPTVHVFVTTLSTPFYANAALIRMESPELNLTRYAISPSADKPVRIVAPGQGGSPGVPGAPGAPGSKGADATSECGTGGRGGDGGAGGPGGPGGDGGPGGVIHVHLDGAAASALQGRVVLANPGGHEGDGGYGGPGGKGGKGGAAGPSGKTCTGVAGPSGADGPHGPPGPPGHPGPPGPPPSFDTGARTALFARELGIIQQIEATPAPK